MKLFNKNELQFGNEKTNELITNSINSLFELFLMQYSRNTLNSKSLNKTIENLIDYNGERNIKNLVFYSLLDCCTRDKNYSNSTEYEILLNLDDDYLLGLFVALSDFENFYYSCKSTLENKTNIKNIINMSKNTFDEIDNDVDDPIYECIEAYNEKIKNRILNEEVHGISLKFIAPDLEKKVFSNLNVEIEDLIENLFSMGLITKDTPTYKDGEKPIKTSKDLYSELDNNLLKCKEMLFDYINNELAGNKKVKKEMKK